MDPLVIVYAATSAMRQIREEELRSAADVLVRSGLRLATGERFVVVGDAESQPMLAALEAAGRDAGAEVAALRLDQLRSYSTNHSGERPHKVLPDGVRRAMLSAQASAFVASAPHPESSMREQLLHVAAACKGRHAHMPGITPLAFAAGLSLDFGQLAEQGRAVERQLEVTREITCESTEGTMLVIKTAEGRNRRWVARLGRVEPGESVTLPAGSIIACPEGISGTFVATASVGEYFGAREGLLPEPVVFELVDGRVMNVLAPGCPHLVRDIENMLHVAPNSDHVGLVVIGVNSGIGEPTGEVCVDQNRPGLHLVFGDPMAKLTGATWSARTSFAACQTRCSVRVDGTLIVDGGKLTPQ
jgi:leucyl aminopeptidase (aminopeptidase T)